MIVQWNRNILQLCFKDYIFIICHFLAQVTFNPHHPNVAFHIETNWLVCLSKATLGWSGQTGAIRSVKCFYKSFTFDVWIVSECASDSNKSKHLNPIFFQVILHSLRVFITLFEVLENTVNFSWTQISFC